MDTLTRFFRPTILWLLAFTLAVTSSCSEKEAVVPKSTEKAITGFSFASLTPAVAATVSGNSITATVPFGTNLTLAPTITASAKATVSPASGSAQDFSKAVPYTVTAEDGSTQTYTVNVGVGAAPKSSAKDITAFAFNGLNPAVNCTINATAKTISATLAAGTDATKLVPTVTVSAKATVSPASGATQDFSKAVVYTVTAEDGTTQAYTANIVAPPAPVVTTKTIARDSDLPDILEDLGNGVDYLVTANISIGGTRVVTVRPGVLIQFQGGSSGFTVSSQAALKMIGTAAKPIILEGKVASAGSWQGVLVRATNIENQWEYVTVSHAGGNNQNGGLSIGYFGDATRISLKNCTFNTNLGHGVLCNDDSYVGNCFTGFANNTFTSNTKSALKIRVAEMGSLDAQSSYANNGQKYIEVAKQGKLQDDITVKKIDVPYRVFSLIEANSKITINAGVTVEFTTDTGISLSYGSSNKNGALVVVGTAADPVKLVAYIAGIKGVWKGLALENGNIETSFKYCTIDGAGSVNIACGANYKAAIIFGNDCGDVGRGVMTNCVVSNSGGYGIVHRAGDSVTLTSNTYSGNTKEDVYTFK